jgi:ribonuclease VapC
VILDTSVVLAMVMTEPGYEELLRTMSSGNAAIDAWLRYGEGKHPASVNFGACLSYAVARLANEPLLYAGEDFAQIDIARP